MPDALRSIVVPFPQAGYGGAIYTWQTTVGILDSQIMRNWANGPTVGGGGNGGGFQGEASERLYVNNSIVAHNWVSPKLKFGLHV